jgi:nucleoside-diphosphate-sugar epimerase
MILVTGGTGLVGSHLLYSLIEKGENVRATYRKAYKLERVKRVFSYYTDDAEALFSKIDWVEADITDIPRLTEIFRDIRFVYHCAAFVSFEPDKYKLLRKINIEGTANIVNLCITNSIKKLCYVSSIAALGHYDNPEQLIHENTAWNPDADNSVYAITKYGAEMEVWRGTQEGVDAIIVNPGIILGAGHWKGGSSGNLFRKIYQGISYHTTGITGYIDVSDVVYAMLSLMESDIKNQGYILVSENWSFKEFLTYTAECLNVTPPNTEAKPWLLAIAWRLDWLSSKLFGKRRSLSKQNAKSLTSIARYDNSKITSTLEIDLKPIRQSIKTISGQFLEDRAR